MANLKEEITAVVQEGVGKAAEVSAAAVDAATAATVSAAGNIEGIVHKQTRFSMGGLVASIVTTVTVIGALIAVVGFYNADARTDQTKLDDVTALKGQMKDTTKALANHGNRLSTMETNQQVFSIRLEDFVRYETGHSTKELHGIVNGK